MPGQPPPPSPFLRDQYGIFTGEINQSSVERIIRAILPTVGQADIGSVHLMFHSNGGNVGDGICLYNFFRALPIDLVIYNPGIVHSIAVVAFLGARKRRTSARATFVLHRSTVVTQSANAGRLKTLAESIAIDDRNTELILREHMAAMPDDLWAQLDYDDLILSGEAAVKF